MRAIEESELIEENKKKAEMFSTACEGGQETREKPATLHHFSSSGTSRWHQKENSCSLMPEHDDRRWEGGCSVRGEK